MNVNELIVVLPLLNIIVDPVEWSWLSGCFGDTWVIYFALNVPLSIYAGVSMGHRRLDRLRWASMSSFICECK